MRAYIVSLMCWLVAGCATNATKESSLVLVDQVDAYASEVGRKLQAEQEFYSQLRKDLEDSARRQATRIQQVEYLDAVTKLTDQAVIRDKGLQLSVLQDFLRTANESGRAAESDEKRRTTELTNIYLVNFETLTSKRRELSNVRSLLLNISREKQTKQQLITFLQDSAQAAIKFNEADDPSDQNETPE